MAQAEEVLERKAQKLMEETESDSRTRVYTGVMDTAVTVILAGFAVFQLWANLTGSLGAILNLTDRMNLRLNLSRGFRAPNLSELGSNGQHEGTFRYEIGNAELAPEFSWQGDVGFDFSSDVLSAQLSLFVNHIDNFIYLKRLPGLTDRFSYTSGDARLWGGEALVDIHPVEPLHFENTFSMVSARQLHQPADARWLPFTPAPRWTSDLRYDIVRDGRRLLNNTFAAVGLECYLRQSHAHTANQTETPTPSYTLVHLSAGTDFNLRGRRLCTLLLTVQNLFDRQYALVAHYPMPGRSFRMQLMFNF